MLAGSAIIHLSSVYDGSSYDRQYASHTSATSAPTSGWTASIPDSQVGKYIWIRERLAHSDGTFGAWGNPVCLTGNSSYTHIAYAYDEAGTGFSTTPNTNHEWMGIQVSTSATAPTTWAGYSKKVEIKAGGTNLMRFYPWTVGTGAMTGWGCNGAANENERVLDTDPFGGMSVIWKAINKDTASDGEGGFGSTAVKIDPTKRYRYSVFMKQTSAVRNYHYFGCSTVATLAGVTDTNPYFFGGADLPVDGKWYLLVAHVHPHSYTGTSTVVESGIYDPVTGKKVSSQCTDFKWLSTSTTATIRGYQYFNATTNEDVTSFFQPRIDVCEEGCPSIAELLRTGSQGPTGATGQSLKSMTQQYYLSTSPTTQTGGTWGTAKPDQTSTTYIWTRFVLAWENPSSTTYTGATLMESVATAIPYVKGTQTAATGAWTGVANTVTSLYSGLTIRYYLNQSPSGNATLNLTLKDGTATGAINCYYGTGSTRLTTHYPVGSLLSLTYLAQADNVVGANGWFCTPQYYSSDNYTYRYYKTIKAKTAIASGSLCSASDETGFFQLAKGVSFNANYPILWASGALAANATTNGYYLSYYSINLAVTLAGFSGLTTYKSVYLVGKLVGTTFTIDSTTMFTQTPPTSEDGKVYIRLGDATGASTIYLDLTKMMFQFSNGAFQVMPGATGPAGTPYFIGCAVSGQAISVKGFDSAGSLSATYGYLYWKNIRYQVNQVAYTPSTAGEGWIAYDISATSGVPKFCKRVPFSDGTTTGVRWTEYNAGTVLTSANLIVIGRFMRTSANVVTASMMSPHTVQENVDNGLMDLLAQADESGVDLNVYARAMGIEKIYSKLASLEMFADKLKANSVFANTLSLLKTEAIDEAGNNVRKGMQLDSDGNISGNWDEVENTGWKIDGAGNAEFFNLKARGNSKFEGLIESQALNTFDEVAGTNIITGAIANDLWDCGTYINALTALTRFNGPLEAVTGSFSGETIVFAGVNDRNEIYYSAPPASQACNAGNNFDLMAYTIPTTLTAPLYFVGRSSLAGNFNEIKFCVKRNGVWKDCFHGNGNFYALPGDIITCNANSTAWWGSQMAYLHEGTLYKQGPKRLLAWNTVFSFASNNSSLTTEPTGSLCSLTCPTYTDFVSYHCPYNKTFILETWVDGVLKKTSGSGATEDTVMVSQGQVVEIKWRLPKAYKDDDNNTVTRKGELINFILFAEITPASTEVNSLVVAKSDGTKHFSRNYLSDNKKYGSNRVIITKGGTTVDSFSYLSKISGNKIIALALGSNPKNQEIRMGSVTNSSIMINGTTIANVASITIGASSMEIVNRADNSKSYVNSMTSDIGVYSSASLSLYPQSESKRIETAELIPKIANTYDIGSPTKKYRDIYSNTISIGSVVKSSNGSCSLPNGMMLKWGIASVTQDGYATTTYQSGGFVSATLSVVLTQQVNNNATMYSNGVWVGNFTSTSFQTRGNGTGGNFYYIAIGY